MPLTELAKYYQEKMLPDHESTGINLPVEGKNRQMAIGSGHLIQRLIIPTIL